MPSEDFGQTALADLSLRWVHIPSCTFSCVLVQSSVVGNWESPAQVESRIKPRMYVRRITSSTMYEKAQFCSPELASVACGFSPIRIHFFPITRKVQSAE